MGEGALNLPMQAAEAPRRLMTKGDFARYRGWKSPSQVSNLIRVGKLKAPALRPDGLIDVDYADAMLARQLDPAKMRTAAPAITATLPSGDLEAVISGQESYSEAKRRAAVAAARTAELNLAQLEGRLIETDAVAKLAFNCVELCIKALDHDTAVDLARRVHGILALGDKVTAIKAKLVELRGRLSADAAGLLADLKRPASDD